MINLSLTSLPLCVTIALQIASTDIQLFHGTDSLQESMSTPLVSFGGMYTRYESTR